MVPSPLHLREVSRQVHQAMSSGTHGTSAKIRSKSRVFPPPRLILGSNAYQNQLNFSRLHALLTSVAIRHHKSFARHSPGLMDQHMCPLVVRVVGDEQSRGLGVMRVEGFNDLGGLPWSALSLRIKDSSRLPSTREQHTCRDTRSLVPSRAHSESTNSVVRLYLEEEWRDHGNSLLTTQISLLISHVPSHMRGMTYNLSLSNQESLERLERERLPHDPFGCVDLPS